MFAHSGSPGSIWYEVLKSETERQSREWDDNISPQLWVAVLAEETGEVAQAILNGNLDHACEEIVQVAAICHRMYLSLNRYQAQGWTPYWQTKPKTGQILDELTQEAQRMGMYDDE